MDDAERTCCNCIYWRMITTIDRGGRKMQVGVCRRYPPRSGHGWPAVLESDFCKWCEPKADGQGELSPRTWG